MKKTALLLFLFFIASITFAAFPKAAPAHDINDSSQILSLPNLSLQRQGTLPVTRLLPAQKLKLRLLQKDSGKKDHRSQWLVSVAGFLLGLTGIGYVITRFTKNEKLRSGAALGFRVLLIALGVYLLAVLVVVLLFASLGLL